MGDTFTNLLYHVIYSTKHRQPLIGADLQKPLYSYIGGIIREARGVLLEMGGMPDHVHIVARFGPTIAVSDMLRLIKANSSKWVNERPSAHDKFEWQAGFSAFSVSESRLDRVRAYARNQEQHHATISFEDEYVKFLRVNNIPFDPRYVFDESHIA